MNEQEQRIAIATKCGWCNIGLYGEDRPNHGIKDRTNSETIPDYLNDLNAMHEVEKVLDLDQWHKYASLIGRHDYRTLLHATAAQRSEAFLKTLNLWT